MGFSDHLRAHLSGAPELLGSPTLTVNLATGTNQTGMDLQAARGMAQTAAVANWHLAVQQFKEGK